MSRNQKIDKLAAVGLFGTFMLLGILWAGIIYFLHFIYQRFL